MADVDRGELERYLRLYQENPDSRVFAPLADLYRRLGRLKEAEMMCREGLQRHPYYAGGKVALGAVLLDAGRLDEALAEVENVVTYYPDNLLARKLMVRILGLLGQTEAARREFETLKALAPHVARDPDLVAALEASPKFKIPSSGSEAFSEFPQLCVPPAPPKLTVLKSEPSPQPHANIWEASPAFETAQNSSEWTLESESGEVSNPRAHEESGVPAWDVLPEARPAPQSKAWAHASPKQALRLARLLKRKAVLEAWLARLSSSSLPSPLT